jgi:hypothetical protein
MLFTEIVRFGLVGFSRSCSGRPCAAVGTGLYFFVWLICKGRFVSFV